MTNEPTVYLAGPIAHVEDDGREWREAVTPWIDSDCEVANPLDRCGPDEVDETVVQEDMAVISECAVVLARWDIVPMAGTPMEIRYADEQDIPVVVWADCPMDEVSPWVHYHADTVVSSMFGAAGVVVSRLRGKE